MTTTLLLSLLLLQAFHVVFLWLHDWIPLGKLNDLQAVKTIDSRRRLLLVTFIQSAPFTVLFALSLIYASAQWPSWLRLSLLCSYTILFIGELQAWWIPYICGAGPERVERYQRMFGNTHSFLPVRNGFAPNTLHSLLHASTFAVVLLLVAMGFR